MRSGRLRRARAILRLVTSIGIGAAIAALGLPSASRAEDGAGFSTSVMRPTAIPESGVVHGSLTAEPRRYYFTAGVKPGDLLTQISASGPAGEGKEIQLEVLDSSARARETVWAQGPDAKVEKTQSFAIDASGPQVLRVTVKGPENGHFCVQIGGTSFAAVGGESCPEEAPARPVAAVAPAPAPAAPSGTSGIEVIESKCEQRLRVGSDVLFDFDSAKLGIDAAPFLGEVKQRVDASGHPVTIEGHTDGKGTDAYNQTLSEARARSVRDYLVESGIRADQIHATAYGKSRPVAPNTNPDGSDNPEGRRRNRRVEIVIDTCASAATWTGSR